MTATTTERASRSPEAAPGSHDVFVARQPIFDRRLRVYGYELPFRAGAADSRSASDDTDATHRAMEAALLDLRLETLVGDKPALVKFSTDLILAGCQKSLPRRTVIELTEFVEPRDDVVEACHRLKRGGYRLALDNVVYRPELEPLAEMVDIIRICFQRSDPSEQCRQMRRVAPYAALLAGQVETHEEFSKATELGFQYVQGWFFCHPEPVAGRALGSCALTHLRLIQAASRPELDLDEFEQVIIDDPSLTHRFMRFLGSAAFGWSGPFTSVRHGLALLGGERTRRWVGLMSLREIAKDKPQELLVQAAIRAKVCERLGACVGLDGREADLFFLGSLSLVDTMLDRSMDDVLAELPLGADLEAALLGESNLLRPVLEVAIAYERGCWEECDALALTLGLAKPTLSAVYVDGVQWAHDVFAP